MFEETKATFVSKNMTYVESAATLEPPQIQMAGFRPSYLESEIDDELTFETLVLPEAAEPVSARIFKMADSQKNVPKVPDLKMAPVPTAMVLEAAQSPDASNSGSRRLPKLSDRKHLMKESLK